MCAALKVTRRGHHAWKRRPPSAHALRDGKLAELIAQVRAEVRDIYGTPKVFLKLRRMGVRTSRKRVARIMRERGWRGVTRACAKRPSGEKRASRKDSAEDLVRRRFEADGPNRARFADITYVKTRQGWQHPALVMDIWSRRIVDWAMGPSITAELADEALKMTLSRRNNPRGVHTPQGICGCHYRWPGWISICEEAGIIRSMSRKGSPPDNSRIEGFFGTMKNEMFYGRDWERVGLEELGKRIDDYIEWYNTKRIRRSMSPLAYRQSLALAA